MMTKTAPRRGPRPTTTDCAPHSQVDQLAPPAERRRLSRLIAQRVETWSGMELGGSRRAPPGTIGFYLDPESATRNPDCFLLGNELAHVHLEDDGSLHAVLPQAIIEEADKAGWIEPHPMAGMPTVSPRTVMIYAPRDEAEVEVVLGLLEKAFDEALEV